MKAIKTIIFLASMAATSTWAAPASNSGSGGVRGSTASSAGSGTRPAGSGNSAARSGQTTAAPRPQNGSTPGADRGATFGSFAKRGTRAPATQRVSPVRASLLAGRTQPSARVTQLIREKEGSGPGWVGTALLVRLLSQHDLSDSDKAWIEGRIATQGKEEDQPTPLLESVEPSITFHIQGLRPHYPPHTETQLHVRATQGPTEVPVRCTLAGAIIQSEGAAVRVKWTPATQGVLLLKCDADGHQHRRLLQARNDS